MNIPFSKFEVNEENDDLQVEGDDNTVKSEEKLIHQLCKTSLTAFAH